MHICWFSYEIKIRVTTFTLDKQPNKESAEILKLTTQFNRLFEESVDLAMTMMRQRDGDKC